MSDWREPLLKPFVTGIARKTVIADPDELFRDDRVFREITDRGFTLIYFEDSISFRYTYRPPDIPPGESVRFFTTSMAP